MNIEEIKVLRQNKNFYREGDKFIKLFDANYSKSDILNEALNQSRVEETGLDIPKILEVSTLGDNWSIVSTYIEGDTLDKLMEQNPDKMDEYLNMFVDLQIKMNSKKCPLLNKLKDKMMRKIDETNLNAEKKYDLHTRLESMPVHTKLCHGDFNPTNIIVAKDGKPYIIDWSHATQGNASADVARTYLLFCLDGKKDIANKYLDLFCKKTRTDRKYVQSWFPIVAASQMAKGNPKEIEFLRPWIDVAEF